jgi:hypothetical protein
MVSLWPDQCHCPNIWILRDQLGSDLRSIPYPYCQTSSATVTGTTPQIPYPREITTSGKRPTKRPSGDGTQPSVVPRKQARHDPWVRPVLIDLPQTSSEVYAGYAALRPSLSDPRRAPHRARAAAKALRTTPSPVPLEGRPWQHVLYDHSSVDDEEREEPVHRHVHSVSTVPNRAHSVARSDLASRASAFSQVFCCIPRRL